MRLLLSCTLTFALAVAGGCTDAGSATDASVTSDAPVAMDAGPPTYENVQRIFTQSCTFSPCHGPRGLGGLVLTPEMSYAQIVGAAAQQVSRLQRVRPGAPAESYLMIKLDGTMSTLPECATPRVCGVSMPQGDVILPAATRDVIREWIRAGAPGPRDR